MSSHVRLQITFSHSQFYIVTGAGGRPAPPPTVLPWVYEQGFLRCDRTIAMITPIDAIDMTVDAFRGRLDATRVPFDTLHAIPFEVLDHTVGISSVGDADVQAEFRMESGLYCLYVGQQVIDAEQGRLSVTLGFDKVETLPDKSLILLADKSMNPSYPLKEWGEWPEEMKRSLGL